MKIIAATFLLAFAATAVKAQAPLTDTNMYWSVDNNAAPRDSGSCVIENNCVLSHAEAGVTDYDRLEWCGITAKMAGTIRAEFFETGNRDKLTIDETGYFGGDSGFNNNNNDRPFYALNVEVDTYLEWDSNRNNNDGVGKGFKICFGLPADAENKYWTLDVFDGSDCVIDGPCIKSHALAGITKYENHELCMFTAKKDGTLFSRFFETQRNRDHVMIGDSVYNGKIDGVYPPASIAEGVAIAADEYLLWTTNNRDNTRRGFNICYEGSEGSAPFWTLEETSIDAECVVVGRCIKSHENAGTDQYQNNERCLFQAKQSGSIKAEYFRTHGGDRVTIGNHHEFFQGIGNRNERDVVGTGMPLVSHEVWRGTDVVWDTNGNAVDYGFEVCFDLSGAGQGDPHFKLWSGDWFDFHGICDQVLTTSPSFGNGVGLDIHVRTKPRYQYSYIEATAIKIGDDVLEIGSWGQYWFNGVEGTRLPKMMAGKYHVEKVLDTKKQHKFVITLDVDKREQIVVHVMKDLVNVNVEHATMDYFGASSGLLGTFPDGVMIARDGATIMEDHDLFGQEWQVMSLDPQLFQSTNKNQQEVGVCAPPMVTEGRRLGEGIELEAAEKACAHHKDEKKRDMCVFDVMAMGDLEMAGINGAF